MITGVGHRVSGDLGHIVRTIGQEVRAMPQQGAVSTLIPELAKVDPGKFGIYLLQVDVEGHGLGDSEEAFSIQSISKVLTLALAFTHVGERLWTRMGVEPSGTAFNSLVQLELEHGRPRNPFINAGALVVADVLLSHLTDPKAELLAFVKGLGGRPARFDAAVAASERAHGSRNAALAHLLRSFGNLHNDVDEVLDLYFHQCALTMSCHDLAHTFLFLAKDGITHDGGRILGRSEVKRINALMQTCGFYDESGEFTYRVGLPGKSGIGGGIVAVHPGRYAVATWSPRLNDKGNSVKGMATLELLTTRSGMSIF